MRTSTHSMESAPSPLLTRRQAATYLALSQRKFDQLAASGEVSRIKIGSSVRFEQSELDACIATWREGGK